jgi:hypothetical protein
MAAAFANSSSLIHLYAALAARPCTGRIYHCGASHSRS